MMDAEDRMVSLFKSQIVPIVKAIQKMLKNKNAKTRQGCFNLLTQLVNVLPGALTNHLAQVIPGINYSLKYDFILFF
jgi:cullin-associated NEDD8-dissociated protein 1